MSKRKSESELDRFQLYVAIRHSQMSEPVDHPWLPRTPAGKRVRRVSDVIDSTGESSCYSSPASSRPRDDGSPFSTASPASAAGAWAGLCARGFVTPQPHRRAAHWNPTVSPDLGYLTPEHARLYTPEPVNNRVELHDALGPGPNEVNYSYTSTEVSGKMPVHKDADRYKMDHRNRGKCVIFNHETFDVGFETREGSSVDAERIEQTFQRLGFSVEICKDYEYLSIRQKITELSQEDHSDSDCICIVILTHGLKNDLLCAKDHFYKLESIWKLFTAERCVTLAGKPKLFFVQACRGDSVDEGVRLFQSSTTTTDSSTDAYKIPSHADFLLAYSTVEGFYSWRNVVEGTWYVQSLCDILDEHAPTMDLARMLTMTARKVAMEFSSFNHLDPTLHGCKQVPMTNTTLTRDLYFTPKNA